MPPTKDLTHMPLAQLAELAGTATAVLGARIAAARYPGHRPPPPPCPHTAQPGGCPTAPSDGHTPTVVDRIAGHPAHDDPPAPDNDPQALARTLRDREALTNEHIASLLVRTCLVAADTHTAVASIATVTVDNAGTWLAAGSRSIGAYLSTTLRVAYGTANQLASTGRRLDAHLPAMACAVLAGVVSWDHVKVAVRHTTSSEPRRHALAALVDTGRGEGELTGDEDLTRYAASMAVSQFTRVAKHFAHVTDPDADERGYKHALEREFVELAPTMGGYHLAGFLTDESGQVLSTALRSIMTPPGVDDTRTASQRRAHALADLARLVLDKGLTGGGARVRPHLGVLVDYNTLEALIDRVSGGEQSERLVRGSGGVGRSTGWSPTCPAPAEWADGSGPIPASMLARLACDSAVSRVVFGPDSEVLDYGRDRRLVTHNQRRALEIRDKSCRWPGCLTQPWMCEGHHVDHWARGGGTDLSRVLLLCKFHHVRVHTYNVTITREGGQTRFTYADGTPVHAPEMAVV